MKRVATALVMLGVGAALGAPASAANVYGSAKLSWTVAASTTVSLVTDYATPTTKQGTVFPTYGAVGAGSCGAPAGSETANQLTFGTITPPAGGYQACNYPQAIALGVSTNDSNGVKVYEYMDVLPGGTQVCVFPNDASFKPNASVSGGAATAAYTGACATGGTPLATMAGASSGAGPGAAGTPAGTGTANATPFYIPWTAGGYNVVNAPGTLPALSWAGQDVQLNVNLTAAATAQTASIVFAVIPQ